jgi:serine/threonine-protein kinase
MRVLRVLLTADHRNGTLVNVVALVAPLPGVANRFSPYEVVREVGGCPNPVYLARTAAAGTGKSRLVVVQSFPGVAKAGNQKGAQLQREARRIATLANPNLAHVREVAVRGDDLIVVSDFIEGEKLEQRWAESGGWLPADVALRMLLDVLNGVGALHGLRDAKQQPMKLAHGELSPVTILFGLDGIVRVLRAVARRAPDPQTEAASRAYLAPEVQAGAPYDARADVYSVGVLLWEALQGRRLFPATETSAPGADGGEIPRPTASDAAPWTKGLADVAMKALAKSPHDRWPTAAAMAAEIRKAAGLKIASASAAAAFAEKAFGERVKARQARMEQSLPAGSTQPDAAGVTQAPVAGPAIEVPVEEVIELDPEAALVLVQSMPPSAPPPPAPQATAAVEAPIVVTRPTPEKAFDTSPSPEGNARTAERRRRRQVVLGAVGALGALIFALAAWQVARPDAHAHPHADHPIAAVPLLSAASPAVTPSPPVATPSVQPLAMKVSKPKAPAGATSSRAPVTQSSSRTKAPSKPAFHAGAL